MVAHGLTQVPSPPKAKPLLQSFNGSYRENMQRTWPRWYTSLHLPLHAPLAALHVPEDHTHDKTVGVHPRRLRLGTITLANNVAIVVVWLLTFTRTCQGTSNRSTIKSPPLSPGNNTRATYPPAALLAALSPSSSVAVAPTVLGGCRGLGRQAPAYTSPARRLAHAL